MTNTTNILLLILVIINLFFVVIILIIFRYLYNTINKIDNFTENTLKKIDFAKKISDNIKSKKSIIDLFLRK